MSWKILANIIMLAAPLALCVVFFIAEVVETTRAIRREEAE